MHRQTQNLRPHFSKVDVQRYWLHAAWRFLLLNSSHIHQLESLRSGCLDGAQVRAQAEHAQRASRAVRVAVLKCAEAVACTLSAAGGDLAALAQDCGCAFDAVIIDEARSCKSLAIPPHSPLLGLRGACRGCLQKADAT